MRKEMAVNVRCGTFFSLIDLIRQIKSNDTSDANDKEMLNPAKHRRLCYTHTSTFYLKFLHLDVVVPVMSPDETFKNC